jgi:type VI secretion system FHA domain protein
VELTLSVLRCPDSVVPEQRRVPGGDYRLGRGAECNWVLADPDRLLSKQHCVLEFRSGGWEVRDTSTNGTFVNHATAPIGRDQSAILNDGDRIRLGAYEIEVRVEQAAAGEWRGGNAMPMASQAAPGWETPAPPRAEWNAQPAAREVGGAWEAQGWEQASQPTRQQDPMAPRIAGDPFAPSGPESSSGNGGFGFGGAPAAGNAGGFPGNDPFAAPSADPYASEAMPDHRSATSDAFLPPRAMQQVSGIPDDWDLDISPKAPVNQGPPPPAPTAPPKALPDDWDLDLTPRAPPIAAPAPVQRPPAPAAPMMAPLPPMAPPPAPIAAAPAIPAFPDDFGLSPLTPAAPASFAPAPPPAPFAPPPAVSLPAAAMPPQPACAPPSPPASAFAPAAGALPPTMTQFHGDDQDPFREDVPVANGGPPPGAPVVVASVPMPSQSPPNAAPVFVPSGSGGDASAGLAAFLAGAGLGSVPLRASPEETLQSLGAAFAAAIGGMRALLIARADVKREFRIEQTMLRAGANNPVKFSASDEQAIAGMIQLGPQKSVAALTETVADLTAHQVATLAATQAAARALLEKLAPAVIESSDGTSGGLFGSKEKKYWEAYKKLHQQVSDQFDDDFDSAFGKEFARAYEQASKK